MKFLIQNFDNRCSENAPDDEVLKERLSEVIISNTRKRETNKKYQRKHNQKL